MDKLLLDLLKQFIILAEDCPEHCKECWGYYECEEDGDCSLIELYKLSKLGKGYLK